MIRTGKELAAACVDVAKKYKTLYVLGCFGAPMTNSNKNRYSNNLSYNMEDERSSKILAASEDTFGFDCVCLIKGLLWGWSGDSTKTYGGAKYACNGVPDISDEQIINVCSGVSTSFSDVAIGELLWMQGHVGIYIGNGLAVECTPAWKDGVQITAVHNIGWKDGYNGRRWTKHGKLPYVLYGEDEEDVKSEVPVEEPVEIGNPVYLPTLQKGSRCESVKALQILLTGTEPGYPCGKYGIDGDFGSATENAVRNFQKAKGIEVDGIVGPVTWSRLLGMK